MKKILLLLLLAVNQFGISAQTVAIDFSYNPGKEVSLCLKNGTACDTIWTGKLDDKGKAVADLRGKADNYAGMATLTVNIYPPASLDIIISGEENVLVSCMEEYPHGGNTIFTGSDENESLQKWFMGQAVRQQKIGLLSEAESMYKKEDAFFPLLVQEKLALENEQSAFEKELISSKLYAAKFMQYHNFLNTKVGGLLFADSLAMTSMRTYVRDSLDVNGLYTSGLWFATLNGLLALYDNDTPYHKHFISDMSLLLERAGSERIYNTLAENLFAICESTGWNDMEEQLAYYLINSGRIQNPTGKLKTLMTLFKLGKGNKVPDLLQGTLPKGNTLLVFYETGCGPCENEMQQLKGNYPLLKERGYEVVSVSADVDTNIFHNTADTFPWADKYCDMKGFDSPDFKNYGVIATPTFYVIKEGILQGRYARLVDTGIMNNEERKMRNGEGTDVINQ